MSAGCTSTGPISINFVLNFAQTAIRFEQQRYLLIAPHFGNSSSQNLQESAELFKTKKLKMSCRIATIPSLLLLTDICDSKRLMV